MHSRTHPSRPRAWRSLGQVRIGLERDAARRELSELRALRSLADETHARELDELRHLVNETEARRLRQLESTAAMTKNLAEVRRSTVEEQQVTVAAAQIEASRQVDAAMCM